MDLSLDMEKVEMGLSPKRIGKNERLNDSELRILIFTATYFVLDGVTLTIRRLATYLRSVGAIVKICSTIPEELTEEQRNEVNDVIVVPGMKIPFAQAGQYSFGIGLDENTVKQIEHFNPNCVHFTVPDFVALDGIRWCQQKNVAYIGTWHSNYGDYLKYYFIEWVLGPALNRYLRGFYEQIPAVFVPTPYMLKRLEDWGYGTCAELKEWGRGIDLKLFCPERRSNSFRATKGFSPSDVVILWVGRLVPEKRPDIWINAVMRLQSEGLPVKAMVVGNGTFEKTLSQLKDVACCGWLAGVALAEAYASADILVFPSDVETFGNVTLEALACGVPCIVEDKCGGHLVKHGSNGFTCTAGDFEGFYQSTKRVVADAPLRRSMSKSAREGAWVFERSKIMQQMAENYKDAAVRHSDPGFMKRRLLSSPEAAGRNFLSILCCNYWFVKTFGEAFLGSAQGVQNIYHGTSECVQHSRSRLNFTDYNPLSPSSGLGLGLQSSVSSLLEVQEQDDEYAEKSRYEDERKGRNPAPFSTNTATCIARAIHYSTIVFSCIIILIFIYAAYTI